MRMYGSFAGKTAASTWIDDGTPSGSLRRVGVADDALRHWEKTSDTLRHTGSGDDALRKT